MKISVIIPVYNSELFLEKCIKSVLNQSYTNWEIIAVDDGSNDNSYVILKKYALLDERIKVYYQENLGPGFARNKAMEHITGEYVVFLDSDDYINPYYFRELNNCVNEYQADVVFIDVIQEKPNGDFIKNQAMSVYKNETKNTLIRYQLTGKLPWGGCRKVVKTSLIKEHEIIYTNDTVGEEALFSFEVLYHAEKISFIDRICYHYVNHPYSQSKKGDNDPWGPISDKMTAYLKKEGLYNIYNKTINSFGYTAAIVSIYRISKEHNIIESIKLSKYTLDKFNQKYTFELDKESLDERAKYMYWLAKTNFVLPIILIAKLKNYINKKSLYAT